MEGNDALEILSPVNREGQCDIRYQDAQIQHQGIWISDGHRTDIAGYHRISDPISENMQYRLQYSCSIPDIGIQMLWT